MRTWRPTWEPHRKARAASTAPPRCRSKRASTSRRSRAAVACAHQRRARRQIGAQRHRTWNPGARRVLGQRRGRRDQDRNAATRGLPQGRPLSRSVERRRSHHQRAFADRRRRPLRGQRHDAGGHEIQRRHRNGDLEGGEVRALQSTGFAACPFRRRYARTREQNRQARGLDQGRTRILRVAA